MGKPKFIDNDEEHNQVLYSLRLLDDEEDWPLYCKMREEESYDTQDVEIFDYVEKYILDNELHLNVKNDFKEETVILRKAKHDFKGQLEKYFYFYIPQTQYFNVKMMLDMEKDLSVNTEQKKSNKI